MNSIQHCQTMLDNLLYLLTERTTHSAKSAIICMIHHQMEAMLDEARHWEKLNQRMLTLRRKYSQTDLAAEIDDVMRRDDQPF